MTTPLAFFVDPAWRRPMQHIPLLYPFWGNALGDSTPFQRALFERHGFDKTHYRIVDDPAQAEVIMLPYSHNLTVHMAPELLVQASAVAEKYKKPLLIDGAGDIEYPVLEPHSIVLRYGGYRFTKRKNEIHIPLYADDLLEAYCKGDLHLRQKKDKPSIGFSGWATLSLQQEMRAVVKELPTRLRGIFDSRYNACKKGVFFRRQAIDVLKRSLLVESNFLIRNSYSGHRDTAQDAPEELQRAFVENLLQSDYGLDVRGDANASIRLFEILSLGRIPVIIDTERNFPFSDILDYSSFSYRIDFRDLAHVPELLAEFHANLSPEKFELMQKNARSVYREYFRVDALTAYIMQAIRTRVAEPELL